jgi:4-hydroxysphinganine ceramide fatty acyl 2-hydroxylase
MPSRTLPTILLSDLATRNTKESCYVTMGQNVYDMTDFIDSHPGGGDLILEYGGKDVTEILKDMVSHEHSEAAYEMLEESHIGFVAKEKLMDVVTKSSHPDEIIPLPATKEGVEELNANGIKTATANEVYTSTGMSSAEDLSVETDPTHDYKTHKFIDLNKPMLMQVWFGGFDKDFYLEQVHRPRHYKGGESAPLFGNFLEPLSKTPWWVIPIVWLPPVAYGSALAAIGFNSVPQAAAYWLFGLSLWTLVEYTLHRCLFHLDE